jgi:hypothetical protein
MKDAKIHETTGFWRLSIVSGIPVGGSVIISA